MFLFILQFLQLFIPRARACASWFSEEEPVNVPAVPSLLTIDIGGTWFVFFLSRSACSSVYHGLTGGGFIFDVFFFLSSSFFLPLCLCACSCVCVSFSCVISLPAPHSQSSASLNHIRIKLARFPIPSSAAAEVCASNPPLVRSFAPHFPHFSSLLSIFITVCFVF